MELRTLHRSLADGESDRKFYHVPFDVYLGPHDDFQPDILFVSKERYSILTDVGAEGAPDFVVEILSPKTATLDRENKRKMYAKYGVPR